MFNLADIIIETFRMSTSADVQLNRLLRGSDSGKVH